MVLMLLILYPVGQCCQFRLNLTTLHRRGNIEKMENKLGMRFCYSRSLLVILFATRENIAVLNRVIF